MNKVEQNQLAGFVGDIRGEGGRDQEELEERNIRKKKKKERNECGRSINQVIHG